MEYKEYKSLMSNARLMADVESECGEYWTGYKRGLRRRFYGDRFGTRDEHEQWMNCARGDYRNQLQAGYRKGYGSD